LCTAYKYKGKSFKEFPYDLEVLKNATPVYKELPGWPETLNKPSSFSKLHSNAKDYLNRLADILRTRITMVSVGSAREDTIFIEAAGGIM
jgi:adenylosuccinate synthase